MVKRILFLIRLRDRKYVNRSIITRSLFLFVYQMSALLGPTLKKQVFMIIYAVGSTWREPRVCFTESCWRSQCHLLPRKILASTWNHQMHILVEMRQRRKRKKIRSEGVWGANVAYTSTVYTITVLSHSFHSKFLFQIDALRLASRLHGWWLELAEVLLMRKYI